MRKYIMAATVIVATLSGIDTSAQAQTSPMRCGVQNMWWRENGNTTYYDQVVCTATENNVRFTAGTANRGNCNLREINESRGPNPNILHVWYNLPFREKTLQFGDRIVFYVVCRSSGVPSLLQYSVTANGTTWSWDVTPR